MHLTVQYAARVDDVTSALAAAISLYGFLALFAVILLAIAVLGFLSAGGARLATDLPHQLGLTGSAARLVHDGLKQDLQIDLYVTRGLPKQEAFIQDLTDLMNE